MQEELRKLKKLLLALRIGLALVSMAWQIWSAYQMVLKLKRKQEEFSRTWARIPAAMREWSALEKNSETKPPSEETTRASMPQE